MKKAKSRLITFIKYFHYKEIVPIEILMVAANFVAFWNPFEKIVPKCHS